MDKESRSREEVLREDVERLTLQNKLLIIKLNEQGYVQPITNKMKNVTPRYIFIVFSYIMVVLGLCGMTLAALGKI
jgi:hypothetical protein